MRRTVTSSWTRRRWWPLCAVMASAEVVLPASAAAPSSTPRMTPACGMRVTRLDVDARADRPSAGLRFPPLPTARPELVAGLWNTDQVARAGRPWEWSSTRHSRGQKAVLAGFDPRTDDAGRTLTGLDGPVRPAIRARCGAAVIHHAHPRGRGRAQVDRDRDHRDGSSKASTRASPKTCSSPCAGRGDECRTSPPLGSPGALSIPRAAPGLAPRQHEVRAGLAADHLDCLAAISRRLTRAEQADHRRSRARATT